ncbi:uncharacterized protein LOC135169425 [Diachasmimorpha longicaudata]|uniref:uncharacterized protein LOC135169425 n=1 Tax=Diachasmimorpha longicaudata TaxID=58733 RepID=UPI0030B87154
MAITRLTGLVSLLILVTSSQAVDATELQFSRDHNRASHHNYHHSRHHYHGSPKVLHDSLRAARTAEVSRLHRHPHEAERKNLVSNGTSKLEKLIAADQQSIRAAYHDDQRFRPRESFGGFGLTSPPVYTKHHPGRRVCSRQPPPNVNHPGTQIRFTYTEISTSGFLCCPGWSQVTPTSYGCNRPTCVAPCYNGGICGTHGKCNCPKGFTGTQCQIDVDECITEKPCAQICKNVLGSYECHCRYGFQLQPDGQSCRKNDSDGTAFEARDLENDYGITTSTVRPDIQPHDTENDVDDGEGRDYGNMLKRLTKLEKQVARDRKREIETIQLNTKIGQAVEGVAELRLAAKNALHFLLETFGPVRQDVTDLKSKFEMEHRRIDYLIQRVADHDHRINGRSG